ncbi:carotenoid cleavage dioxygenase [Amycolatopsis xylanica]|uniref:Dioxygenase n=1 Tax=Amycolatopsis xylanica TaxID=589385 RepID=A0A1H3G4M2_9PSEU|nr:carotenoid oxygenase family protein [Amycolatopsis xylanica]SDX98171.1 carotenoid cleavage dioxygenase [Amycolatopsis xylanica]
MATTTFHRKGNYAPVHDELTAYDLEVTGAIPPELTGWYLRNGPNPRDENKHWFIGEGMLHGVRLENGRAAWYRNRWVRTASFLDSGRSLYRPDGSRDLHAANANTHIINHAGRTLALVESSLPYEVTNDLETVGAYDFDGRLCTPMTAHPKICPTTGELHFFGYDTRPPFLTYHRADAEGNLVVSQPIEVAAPTMMHDFNLTANHVVFMDLPLVFDRALAGSGEMPYRWDDHYGARLGVLRRDDPTGAVRWFTINPCYVFHALNAHESGDRIVLYVIRQERTWHKGYADTAPLLWRWTIDLTTGSVREEQVDDGPCEFPRVDDRLAGLDSRFGHATGTNGPDAEAPTTLRRFDLHRGTVETYDFGKGRTPGEAVFVPSGDGEEGWLMTYVYDAARDGSDLVIIDPANLSGPPVATVHLPQRVPAGFHGNWIPEA